MSAMTTRKRRLLIALAIVVVLVGATVAAAAFYVTSVSLPGQIALPESTVMYYSDGTTVMARLGAEHRVVLAHDEILSTASQAAVAAYEPDYWNSKGGPIARRVVRHSFDIQGAGASTRLRVAVMARKLDDEYAKDRVLGFYLNAMPYGRRAFGVEAAAQAYFGKSVHKDAKNRASTAEAIVLATMIDQTGTEPSPQRWTEVRDTMVDLGYLARADADGLTFPADSLKPYTPGADDTGLERPTGLVVNHVLAELSAAPPFQGWNWDRIANGGFKIVTTVDHSAQQLLEQTADATASRSVMHNQPKDLQAAAVSVEPGTGRVIAYYGGHNGAGADYAGWYRDEDGVPTGFGAHRPGSSFHVFALAAAIKDGISLDSRWNGRSGRTFPGRSAPVRNTSTCAEPYGVRNGPCTLLGSSIAGVEVAIYAVTQAIGSANVLEMAKAAGIADMWDDERERVSLADSPTMAELSPSRFATEVGLGQYPVTVLDQANAMATFAAGVRAQAHFVRSVTKGSETKGWDTLYSESMPAQNAPRVLTEAQAADLTWALSHSRPARLAGVDAAGKSGSWIDGSVPTHAWMTGYTTSLATAVWIGSAGRERPLRDSKGQPIYGSGLPATVYRTFMTGAHAALKLKPGRFPPPAHVGDPTRGDATG
jgi:membrane peptidoglycan carboxypeptidase